MARYKSIPSRLIFLVTILTFLATHTQCLYEDQMGLFDWKQSYIGKLRHATFDSMKRIIIATEENVLAAISLKTGEIAWRQVLEDPAKHKVELLHAESQVTTVSGDGNTIYVRGWDPYSGTITFEWSLTVDAAHSKWLIHGEKLLHIVPIYDSHLEVTEYQVQTGKNKGRSTKIQVPFMTDIYTCVTAQEYWVCLYTDKLYYMSLLSNDNKVHHRLIEDLIGDDVHIVNIEMFDYNQPSFLLIRRGITRLVLIDSETSTLTVESTNFTTKPIALDNNQILTIDNENSGITTLDLSSGATAQLPLDLDGGDSTPIMGACKGVACRLLTISNDDSIRLIQLPQGKTLWTREEALSAAIAVEFVELPVSAMDASIADAFAVNNDSNDILSMFIRRLSYQAQQLKAFIAGVKDSDDSVLVRDDFGLHKLIIIASRVGKLFALDTISGNIVWSKFIPKIKPFKSFEEDKFFLYELRNARHSQPVMLLVARCAQSGNGVMYKFNPIKGEILDEVKLKYKIKQMMKLPYEDGENLKGLVILSKDDQVDYYPESIGAVLKKHLGTTFLYSTDETKQTLTGYHLHLDTTSDKILALPSWTFRLPSPTHSLLSVVVRPHLEQRVHSQGRVLADRSVAYKYVNPNLLAVAVQTRADPVHRNVFSVYLVDAVTGLVLHGLSHKRARGLNVMVHSENWLVYGYFNERFRRYELTSMELYEGSRQSNSTAFSSHALAQLPHVETTAYILPTHPVHLATTLTERGITNKNILIALPSGAVVEVPWAVLEPRYQTGPPTDEYAPIPYMPEVPLIPEATVNYNRSVARLRGICVAPARLESTALVLLHGLDLFYTRVAPSRTFDVLKEDFDHWLIVTVLAGLTIASYVTKRLSKRKMVKQAWK